MNQKKEKISNDRNVNDSADEEIKLSLLITYNSFTKILLKTFSYKVVLFVCCES